MKLLAIPNSVAADRKSAQNWVYEANSGITGSRKSGEGAGETYRKGLDGPYPSPKGEEITGFQEIHGFLEEENSLQIFKAAASAAGSSPNPSAWIDSRKSFSFFKCKRSFAAFSCSLLNFSAAASLGRRPLRRSSFITEKISSFLGSTFIVIMRYINLFLLSTPVPLPESVSLTLAQGRRYTGISRWECNLPLRASCHSTRRSSGLPSGIYELNLTSTGSLLPLCAAPETYEHR
jgi:hypothetical protein